MEGRLFPRLVPAAHPGIRRFNAYLTGQNVAGLWLLYGVRP